MNRATLERVLELQKNEFYWKGLFDENNQKVQSRVEAMQEYNKLRDELCATYKDLKKGDKVLMIKFHTDIKNRRDFLKAGLSKGTGYDASKYTIEEFVIHAPIKTRVKKNVWVGDGYDDEEVTTFKYIDGNYIVTDPFPMSKFMIKI